MYRASTSRTLLVTRWELKSCTTSTLDRGAAVPRLGRAERPFAADELGARALAAGPGGRARIRLLEAEPDTSKPRNAGPRLAAFRLLAGVWARAARPRLADRRLRVGALLHAHAPARPDRRPSAALL